MRTETYDAIIVGGGLAGLVVANRLSEDASKKILVIEAGVDRRGDARIDTPGLLMSLWGDKDYDWDFYSEAQEALGGRQIPQPRGKVLGGSSAINVTAIAYPTRRDFESWTNFGNKGWTHEDLAPYFRRFHTFHPASKGTNELLSLDSYMDQNAQGTDGPLAATFVDAYGPFNSAWMGAFGETGFANTKDPILGQKLGPFTPPNSIDPNGNKRSYSASAYYNEEIERRPNLHVLTETQVARVLHDGEDGCVIATGVEIVRNNGSVTQISGREVILSAGAFQSPQILERSGIGSREILGKHGIPVVVNNRAVGENLQDHCFSSISFQAEESQMTMDAGRDPNVVQALLQLYNETRTGPLSGVPFSLAYLPAVDLQGRMDVSAVQDLLETSDSSSVNGLRRGVISQDAQLRRLLLDPEESTLYYGLMAGQMNIGSKGKTSMQEAYRPQLPDNYITIMVGLNHPFSRGSVHIRDGNLGSTPIIDPRYLSHPLDLELLGRGMQFLEPLVQTSAFAPLLRSDHRIPSQADLKDLKHAKELSKERLWTTYHPTSTCAMKPRKAGGVVDDRLVVHGTKNVRVIDASIFPMITLGNIQATVYAVAERGSDLIKGDWLASRQNGI